MQRGAEFEHQILNALRGVMVQVAGWLIEQYQCRLVDQCPSDGHALSLATGQLRRLVLQAMAEADPLQQSDARCRASGIGVRPISSGMQTFSSAVNSASR